MDDRIIEEEAREFQETILRLVNQHLYPYLVKLRGQEFMIFPETFNPNYAKAALFLLDNLGVKPGDVVLDPFTGCGAVAIDKYDMPYTCSQSNVRRLNLDNKIDVRKGDLFDPLSIDEKFDLVIANPPFKRMEAKSCLEAAIRDEDYKTLNRFFSEVGDHLAPDGRMRIVFSNVGDLDYFETLAKKNHFHHEIVAQTKFASSVLINVYEMRKKDYVQIIETIKKYNPLLKIDKDEGSPDVLHLKQDLSDGVMLEIELFVPFRKECENLIKLKARINAYSEPEVIQKIKQRIASYGLELQKRGYGEYISKSLYSFGDLQGKLCLGHNYFVFISNHEQDLVKIIKDFNFTEKH